MLYKIFADAPWSIIDKEKKKYGAHANDIVGSKEK
jgi:hypothetical protein